MLSLFVVGALVLLAADQISKWIVLEKLTQAGSIPLIRGVLHFTYCENRGAAFGIMQNRIWIFAAITVVVLVAVCYYMVRYRPKRRLTNVALTLLAGGALGNLVDRVFRGFVVDFIDFRWINFPIFNLADCFVVIGSLLLALAFLTAGRKKENRS